MFGPPFLVRVGFTPILFLLLALLFACGNQSAPIPPGPTQSAPTFAEDLALLQGAAPVQLLRAGEGVVAVSGQMQGKVFTSSTSGPAGRSLGWFKREAFRDGSFRNRMGSLGGEERLWFGPDFGRFNVFVEPGLPQTDETRHVPPPIDTLYFAVTRQNEREVVSEGAMSFMNYRGYVFDVFVRRRVAVVDRATAAEQLGQELPPELDLVTFTTETDLTNRGARAWARDSGLFSVWHLSCQTPTDSTTVIIPLRGRPDSIVNYFSPHRADRLRVTGDHALYRADANYLNKIGVPARHTTPAFGSYSPELDLLTIVQFTFSATDSLYVNAHPSELPHPLGGDVVNVFNDGITPSGGGPYGPFHELESSSPARELAPGQRLRHGSTYYHLRGPRPALDAVAHAVLGLRLEEAYW